MSGKGRTVEWAEGAREEGVNGGAEVGHRGRRAGRGEVKGGRVAVP